MRQEQKVVVSPRTLTCGDVEYSLCALTHDGLQEASQLSELVRSGGFDALAVELCPTRHSALLEPEAWGETDLFALLRQGRAGQLAVSLALNGWQQRLAEQAGEEPGAALRAVIEAALEKGQPVLLIDRDLGITLKRLSARLSRAQRLQMFGGLLEGMLSKEPLDEATRQRLREGDLLETVLAPYVAHSEALREVLIGERDRYMAARLCEEQAQGEFRRVLVVAGEGHLEGVAEALAEPSLQEAPQQAVQALEQVAPRSRRWRYLPWLVVALIVGGFVYGFSRSSDIGSMMVLDWILINGVLSGLGAAVAGGHPLTILTAFIAAPWTSLNPMIGASMVAGGMELYLRKPRVSDFDALRHDLSRLSGWWRNRVSRTLMVFFLAGFGSSVGTYVAGFRIYDRLMGG